MGKKKTDHGNSQRKKKATTAITFDEDQRANFLKGMFGAKKRRQQFHKKRVQEQIRQTKIQDRAEIRENRREQLRKSKAMLDAMKDKIKLESVDETAKGPQIKVKKEANVVIETRFY